MGYHIIILRTTGRQQIPISKEEFTSAALGIPGLRVNESAGAVEMHAEGQLRTTLTWNDGEIWSKVPEPDVIELMLKIANRLNARVRGDDLETYLSGTESFIHPDDKLKAETTEEARNATVAKHKRRQWLWNAFRIAVLAVVIILVLLKWMNS